MPESDSDDSQSHKRRRHKSSDRKSRDDRRKKRSSSHRRHSKKRRREPDSNSDSDSNECSNSDSNSSYRRERRRKDKKRKDKHREKDDKHDRRRRHEKRDEMELSSSTDNGLIEALYAAMKGHPALISDLPIMLVRMAGGATFDLTSMTDYGAAQALSRIFTAMEPFGVALDGNAAWTWKAPAGGGRGNNELVLVKVVRTVLDQQGLSLEAVEEYERGTKLAMEREQNNIKLKAMAEREELQKNMIRSITSDLFNKFTDSSFRQELTSICQMILDGESICLDDLPSVELKNELERLFIIVGLERSEIECESESENDDKDKTSDPEKSKGDVALGYGLPEIDAERSTAFIQAVINTCKGNVTADLGQSSSGAATSQIGGESSDDSDDDIGPLQAGVGEKRSAVPADIIKAQAVKRSRQLSLIASGQDDVPDDGAREEWMLVPGKFDFLNAIKSGNPMKNRQFVNKKTNDRKADASKLMDPKVQAEIDSIMKAHQEARGPSLIEEHRQKKAEEALKKAGTEQSWKWSRDGDLDSGRRVDKNALSMVLGGAADSLKSKFQGGFTGDR